MRIAMLGHKRIPSREGGIEVVVEELSSRMVKIGHHVTCYNRSGHHVSGKEYEKEIPKNYKGIQIKQVPCINRKGIAAVTASFFGTLAASFGKFDIIHFHAEGTCIMIWFAKLLGKKCVVTIHGLDHKRAKWNKLASWIIKRGEKNAVRYADEIIVLSKGVQDYFEKEYGRKTVFIPNGVSRPKIKEAEMIKEKYGLGKDDYILFLGRLVPEKGIMYLVDAFRRVKTNKKLVIAGGSSDTKKFEEELKEKAKKDPRIIFTGFVQGQLLEELYSNAYIYTLPSELEGMPLSLLEAMSYGNCCIVSDIEECAAVVNDKAILVHKSDVSDLRKKLQYACDHRDVVVRYKEQAADYICTRYSWDDVTMKTLNLYERVRRMKKK